MSYEDEDYFLPLEDQRVFGAGITKKRVPFVRSSDHELSTLASSAPATPASTGSSIANKYLSIVMKNSSSSESTPAPTAESETTTPATFMSTATPNPPAVADSSITVTDRSHSAPPQPTTNTNTSTTTTCEVCNLPLASTPNEDDKSHESSLAHQVCLTHSHPPSHLDRKSHGLRYLESYGWNPDSRLGLGAEGREGIRVPVKGKLKADTVGLGAVVPTSSSATKKRKEKVQKLNAKQVRKGHFDARRKGDKLRELFYQDDEVLRHLGKS